MHEQKDKFAEECEKLRVDALRTARKKSYAPLPLNAQYIVSKHWELLLSEGQRLQSEQLGLEKERPRKDVQECLVAAGSLLSPLLQLPRDIRDCVQGRPTQGSASRPVRGLNVGCGVLGYPGCACVTGSPLNWNPFVMNEVGVLSVMKRLNLDIIGLPGSRLASNAVIPTTWGIEKYAKWEGGASYASCCVVWRTGVLVRPRKEMGSSRILVVESMMSWMCPEGPHCTSLWCISPLRNMQAKTDSEDTMMLGCQSYGSYNRCCLY